MQKLASSTFCKNISFYALFLAMIMSLSTGCSTTKITVSNASSKSLDKSKLKKIAVVPFELILSESANSTPKTAKIKRRKRESRNAFNKRKQNIEKARKKSAEDRVNLLKNSAKIVSDLFVAELFNIPEIEVFTVERIEMALRNMALDPDEVFEKSTNQEIAQIIGLDGFFSGKVFSYYHNKSSNPLEDTSNVSISVELISAKTSEMLWTGREAIQGQAMDLGVLVMRAPSAYELASGVVKNIVASFKNSLY